MKAFFLTATLFTSALAAQAQPVLSPQYYGSLGTSFSQEQVGGDSAGFHAIQTGPNQIWDFSTFFSFFPANAQILPASSGQEAAFFPRANALMKFEVLGIEIEFYQENNPRGAHILGYNVGGSIATYTPAQVAIPAGLSYGQSFSQSVMEKKIDPLTMDTVWHQINETITYSGYGAVMLPGNTYSDVILTTIRSQGYKSDNPAGPFTISDTTCRYAFFAPGIGYPLVEYGKRYENDTLNIYASFVSNLVTSVRSRTPFQAVSVAPQPARDQATLRLPAGEAIAKAAVLDMMGRQVAELPLSEGRISVASLQPGAYWVEARGKKTYRARLIKE